MIQEQMLAEMKLIYSAFVSDNFSVDKQKKYYDLINSIPDDLFNSKNPLELAKRGKKLSAFFSSMRSEMEKDGIKTDKLLFELKKMNERNRKMLRGF